MSKRFSQTFFCRLRLKNKMVGHQYGIAEGQVVPSGFEVGEEIVVYYHRSPSGTDPQDKGGFGTEVLVLTEETFSGSELVLSSGLVLNEEEVSSCYRLKGFDSERTRSDA